MISRSILAAGFALLACTTAFAQEGTHDAAALSTRSRADVAAELEQARAARTLDHPGELYGSVAPAAAPSTLTRAEVRADFESARRAGTLDERNASETYGSFRPDELSSAVSRAQVRAELEHVLAGGARLSQGERGGS